MTQKPTYEELEYSVQVLERESVWRKQAQEALRLSEEKYRSLVESSEDSIYLVDKSCRYLFVNQKFLSRFSLPMDRVIGTEYGEVHSKEEAKDFAEKVNKVFKTGKSLRYEYQSERDDRYFIRTLSPVREPDGRLKALTVISKEITERKQAEEELRQAHDELEQRVEEHTAELTKANERLKKEIDE